ncbi:MAG: hypothetical protein SGI87_10575 [Flavobacteriales bacterium]|nr:hypothetical protein [Flavobacteriales bacterium]
MKILRTIKTIAGRNALKREKEPERVRKGSNFANASKVAFIYLDSNEEFFRTIKSYIKQLKAEFNIKTVSALGYVDADSKRMPVWQNQKLEFEYFNRGDLNWHLKPVGNVTKFVKEDFDILIDLTDGKALPLNFVVRESRAYMKVGIKGSKAEKYYDLIIDMGHDFQIDKYLDQIKLYLSNPKIK